MLVSVTEEDIVLGNLGSSITCPIALAIRRTINAPPQSKFLVSVGQTSAVVKFTNVALPERAQLFVDAYDETRRGLWVRLKRWLWVRPFTFDLPINNILA